MARPKGGLGRGLDSLFADVPSPSGEDATVTSLPVREIEPDPDQPRKTFDETALAELSASIAENGLLQPIAVRPKKAGPGYVIIARRAPLAGRPHGRPGRGSGAGQGSHRRAGRRAGADREPAAGGPGPHRGGRGLPAADRKIRPDPGNPPPSAWAKAAARWQTPCACWPCPTRCGEQVRTGKLTAGHAKALLLGLSDAAVIEAAGAADRGQGHERPPGRGAVPQAEQAPPGRQRRRTPLPGPR